MSRRSVAGRNIEWPGGRRFAFTVFDDTDWTTLENGPPVYRLLDELGMRVTKSVWPLKPTGPHVVRGANCAEPDYLDWVRGLQANGHEIGYHNAAATPSTRSQTIDGLDRFEELFGHPPRVGADHSANLEALYCGPRRLSGTLASMYRVAQRVQRPDRPSFSGEEPTSDYFWGDVCRDRITYWRGFTFSSLNLFDAAPRVTYHDPRRHYVNYWFTSTDAPSQALFVDQLAEDRLDQLEASGGLCIMYTHFGVGFAPDGHLDPSFARAMERLASRSVWVAPVSEVLDHLRSVEGNVVLTNGERSSLERRWVADRVRYAPLLRGRKRAPLAT